MINRLRKEEAGFTLVELLVVVLILGILVAIAVPNFTGARGSAEEGAAKANLRTAQSEIAANEGAIPAGGLPVGVTNAAGTLTSVNGGASCTATFVGAITC